MTTLDKSAAPYCEPKGDQEFAYGVGHALAGLLDALDGVNESTCIGQITDDVANLSYLISHRLKTDGWRFRLTPTDRWDVRPPASGNNVESKRGDSGDGDSITAGITVSGDTVAT